MKLITKIAAFVVAAAPVAALAQSNALQPLNNVNDVANRFTSLLNTFTVLLIALAVVWIIISVVRYLIAGGDTEKRKEGGLRILYGIIGLFVIISIWGLVSILQNSFGTTNTAGGQINNIDIIKTAPPVQ
jgi:bacteriorhodopsin